MQKSHGKMLTGQKITIFRKAVIMVIFGDFAKGLIRPNGQKWPISGVNLNRPKTYQLIQSPTRIIAYLTLSHPRASPLTSKIVWR